MNTSTIFAFLSASALALAAARASAQDDQRLVVPLSDPSRPAILEVALFSGDIEVEGYDGNEIVIVADAPMRDANGQEEPRPDGLRRIQTSSVGLTVEEGDNRVSLRMDFSPKNVDLEVRVPRRTSVHASLVNGGDIVITGVTGEHELSNINGDVVATDISGSAVMNATNGDVNATLAAVDAHQVHVVHVVQRRRRRRVARESVGRLARHEPARRRVHGFRRQRATGSGGRRAQCAATRAAVTASACIARRATRSAAAGPTFSCARSTATS